MTFKRSRGVAIMDKELDRKVDLMCKDQHRTFSNMVQKLLIDEVRRWEKGMKIMHSGSTKER